MIWFADHLQGNKYEQSRMCNKLWLHLALFTWKINLLKRGDGGYFKEIHITTEYKFFDNKKDRKYTIGIS